MDETAAGRKTRILVLEDETVIVHDIRNSLVKRGHVAVAAASGEEA